MISEYIIEAKWLITRRGVVPLEVTIAMLSDGFLHIANRAH